jgi:hypothetical protein
VLFIALLFIPVIDPIALIVVLANRNKQVNSTFAVCQWCGTSWRMSEKPKANPIGLIVICSLLALAVVEPLLAFLLYLLFG